MIFIANLSFVGVLKLVYLIALCFLNSTYNVVATGKGTVGVYAINDSYAAVTDSNFDAIFILDLILGGIAGQLVLHDADAPSHQWTDPTGITSCDACPFFILTSTKRDNMYKVMFPNNTTLLEMASQNDFSSLSDSTMVPYWPWDGFLANGKIKMTTMKQDGSMGYVAHLDYGLFSIDPLHGVRKHEKLLVAADDIPGNHVAGLTLMKGEKNIILTTPEIATDFKLVIDRSKGITEAQKQETIDLTEACKTGEYTMHFRDTVYFPDLDSWIAVGHKGGGEDNRGMTLYNITYDMEHKRFNCDSFAGDDLTRPGWVDGSGTEVRFSRPHAMTLTPTSKELLITDIDNRALRKVNLDVNSKSFGQVYTVSYNDDDLWTLMYGNNKSKGPRMPKIDSVITATTTTATTATTTTTAIFPKHEDKTNHLLYWPNSYHDAQNYCHETYNGRLCSLNELRTSGYPTKSISSDLNSSFSNNEGNIRTWTSNSCGSCWLHYPGHCDIHDDTIVESAAVRDGSYWGDSVFMIANLSSGGSAAVETQCRSEDTILPTLPVCCIETTTADVTKEESNNEGEQQSIAHTNGMTSTIGIMSAGVCGAFLVSLAVRKVRKQDYRLQEGPCNIASQSGEGGEGFEPVKTSEFV